MNDIKVMSDNLANKIAAGEIIERPLSVVKELVENSLDSGCSKIEVKLIDSGLTSISVVDNGHGMNKDNLEKSIIRHATSKLYSDEDLFKISTLGFRGEALASMFAVSKMTITSSTNGSDGHILQSEGDGNYNIKSTHFNSGTQVMVNNLFFNTPVRYKHLSNPIYELSLVANYLNKIALSLPNISFSLINNDKSLLKTSGNDKIQDVFANVYSIDIARNLITKESESDNFKIRVSYAKPEYTRSKKSFMTICVNSRIVSNYKIENQILESFKDYLHTNQYPIILVDITLDYSLVDVNVHPNKSQVNISLIDDLNKQLNDTIKMGLDNNFYVPKIELEHKDEIKIMEEKFSDYNTYEVSSIDLDMDLTITNDEPEVKDENKDNEVRKWKLPIFDYIGTFDNTYLLFQNSEGMYLVDQHAAQERINYELILNKFENREFIFQQLLMPIVIEVSTADNIDINQAIDAFLNVGIKMEVFGYDTIKVVEIDNFYLKNGNLESDILNLLAYFNEKKTIDFAKIYEDIAIMMACKSSIKAHDYINQNDISELLQELNTCEFPYTCPHGRPIIVNITSYEIQKLFKRVF